MKKALKKPVFSRFSDIEPMKRLNLIAKIVKVETVNKIKRIDADPVDIAICKVGDETGCAIMLLKGPQVVLAKEDKVLILRNVLAKMVKDRVRLEVDIWGKVEESNSSIKTVNLANDISAVEYEAVPVKE